MFCKGAAPLANGFRFGEGPRWFEGLLWFSGMLAEKVHLSRLDTVTVEIPGAGLP